MDIFERAKRLNLPLGQYALFGSLLLDVFGIRRANDLDIVATPELYEKLKNEGWEERQANGFTMLVRDDANVTTVQDKPTDGQYCPDRVQLVKDAVVIKGIPFIRVEEVIACKKDYNRPKDLVDIASLEAYIKDKGWENLYNID